MQLGSESLVHHVTSTQQTRDTLFLSFMPERNVRSAAQSKSEHPPNDFDESLQHLIDLMNNDPSHICQIQTSCPARSQMETLPEHLLHWHNACTAHAHMTESYNQTTLGLAVKLHHRFVSKELVALLHEYGITVTYCKVYASLI